MLPHLSIFLFAIHETSINNKYSLHTYKFAKFFFKNFVHLDLHFVQSAVWYKIKTYFSKYLGRSRITNLPFLHIKKKHSINVELMPEFFLNMYSIYYHLFQYELLLILITCTRANVLLSYRVEYISYFFYLNLMIINDWFLKLFLNS